MRSFEQITNHVESLRREAADRDQRHRNVKDVRSGDVDSVIPGSMPDAWPHPIVANLIDTTARDMAEVMGAMPSVNCASGILTSERARKFSSRKTKIANYYIQSSGLQSGRQVTLADHFITYGMAIYVVEPDFETKRPHIRVENPMCTYPEWDLFGRLKSYTKVWREGAIKLAAKYPEILRYLQSNETGGQESSGWAEREIEVAKYMDASQMVMYLPGHGNKVIHHMENPMGRICVSIGRRPGYDSEIRGAFDDAIWVQLAKARMALLGLEATEKTVRAPLAVPRDVTKMTFGDDAIIRTDSPEKIRRIGVDVPQAAFQEGAMLDQELRQASRSPEVRSGNLDASIITGKGVQALMGGFNTVISTGQTVIAEALKGALEICFAMDEKLWGRDTKTVQGLAQGTPFTETYTPSVDIAGDHSVDVTYGFAAGQDPARAIVGLLQLRGDQLISRDFFQRQLPMNIDVVQMQTQIDLEQFNDALKQGIMAYMQAILPMAQQAGQDPTEALARVAKLIKLREKGTPVADAIERVFKPKEQPQQAAAPQDPMAALLGGAGGPAAPAEGGAPAMGERAPGASQAPQGLDLMSLLSGMTSSGDVTMSARSQRQSPI